MAKERACLELRKSRAGIFKPHKIHQFDAVQYLGLFQSIADTFPASSRARSTISIERVGIAGTSFRVQSDPTALRSRSAVGHSAGSLVITVNSS